MSAEKTTRRRGSYGIDAPYMLCIPILFIVANVANGVISRAIWPFMAALLIVAFMACGLYTSRRGKFVVWVKLLDQLNLRGDELILDIGCGRGAVLLMAAQRLSTGRAVGIDLWKQGDQSGNSSEAALRNAALEGVAHRVEVHTADMTALPFESDRYDVVVSNVAIHNVRGRAGRDRAIHEAVRVLRPGGRLMIADIRATADYAEELAKGGMLEIKCRNLGWRMWWSGPWMATRLVTATKPSSVAPHVDRQTT